MALRCRPELGPIGYGVEVPRRKTPFAGSPYAEQTQHAIDLAVAQFLRKAECVATGLLSTHRHELDQIVLLLLDPETVIGSDLLAVLGASKTRPSHQATAPTAGD